MKYTVSKDMSANTIKNDFKARLTEAIMEALRAMPEIDDVQMVRVGNASGAKNLIGVKAGTVTDDGEFDLCATVDITPKEWVDKFSSKTGKLWRAGFDFETAVQEYEDYLAKKEQSAAEKALAKEKKIAADKAAREAKNSADNAD